MIFVIIYVIGLLILIIVVCAIILFFKYSKLKDIRNSLEMCTNSINEALDEKLKLVNEFLSDIKDESIKNSFNYDEGASLYEREDVLFNVSFEINKFVKEGKNKKLKDKLKILNELEENLDGLKDYYNANVLNYNEIFLKKYFHKFFQFLKFDSYKSFKIRKLEQYEIFKN